MRINFIDGAIPFAMGNVPCVVVGTSPMEGGIRQCCVGVTRLAEDGECTVEVVHDPHPEADGFVEGRQDSHGWRRDRARASRLSRRECSRVVRILRAVGVGAAARRGRCKDALDDL